MKKATKKLYTRKRPAHPDEAHTASKRWFKKKGRKAVRKHLKQELEKGSY
ncbi:MAG: hypothetical protein HOB92_07680 [Candidatus Cloacimonetes bacterium]|jgi:hypothetical protein|nr:hypothetical protein [Candidatus Cloacimonadota bacterium]MBT4576333.1 hypothetical protein [Candidatus Cloacimonadota bacterium]